MPSIFKNNKGFVKELGLLPTIVILMVVAALVASLGQQLLGESRLDQAQDWCSENSYWFNSSDNNCMTNSSGNNVLVVVTAYDHNATLDSQSGINELSSKFDTMGLAIAVVLVLAIIMGAFAYIKMR